MDRALSGALRYALAGLPRAMPSSLRAVSAGCFTEGALQLCMRSQEMTLRSSWSISSDSLVTERWRPTDRQERQRCLRSVL